MEKLATEDVVWRVCDRLKAEGRKITGRAVLSEVGGSLSTVLKNIESWRANNSRDSHAVAEIPAELQSSISRALGQAAMEATEALRVQMEESISRETEAVEALGKSEERIVALEKELSNIHAQYSGLRQTNETEAAVAAEALTGLREQVGKLEQENDHLIRAGEAARTETAKAMLQVERADMAASKADARVLELEAQVALLLSQKAIAEKGEAVAVRHAQNLVEQTGKLEARLEKSAAKIEELEVEKTGFARELTIAESARRKAEGANEQMELRIQEISVTNERLRKELEINQSIK